MKITPRTYQQCFAALWVSLLIGSYVILLMTELTVAEIVAQLFLLFTVSWWGIGLFLLLYIARPLTLLPMSVFSILSGVFFGLWIGAVVVYAGIIISAAISYIVGRWLQHSVFRLHTTPLAPNLMQRRPFEVVTGLHLTMLPFDLINYGAGLLQIPWRPFISGVLVGMIPGTISLTAFGAAMNLPQILAGDISWNIFNWWYLGLSAVVFGATLIGSYWWRRHTQLPATPTDH